MEKDTQLMHHLYWLHKFLTESYQDKEYKDFIKQPLSDETTLELNTIVKYINTYYQ